jgi:hypothetical protein
VARTSTIGTFNTGDIWSEAVIDSLPAGCLNKVKRTTNTSAVSTQSDITGMAFSVTFNANRLIELKCWISAVSASDTSTWGQILIIEGSTTLAYAPAGAPASAGLGTGPPVMVLALLEAPAAGSHTYKLALDRAGGSGTVTAAGAVDRPMVFMATDIGPNF